MIRIARQFSRSQAPSRNAVPNVNESDGEQAPAACGWFDSSHELTAGLQVCEHTAAGADAVLASLPLASWLELQLWAWRGAAAAQ